MNSVILPEVSLLSPDSVFGVFARAGGGSKDRAVVLYSL